MLTCVVAGPFTVKTKETTLSWATMSLLDSLCYSNWTTSKFSDLILKAKPSIDGSDTLDVQKCQFLCQRYVFDDSP